MYKNNTLTGTRDLIFEEIENQNKIIDSLVKVYSALGYRPVATPALEFYDVFDTGNCDLNETALYKFSDRNGRIAVVRPDNTAPIARLVSAKLNAEQFPLLLYCNQPVFRDNTAYAAKKNEIFQSGIEIIGGTEASEDSRCLFTAHSALSSCSRDYKIEIGHAKFFDALMEEMVEDENQRAELKKYLAAKNSGGMIFAEQDLTPEALRVARLMPRLCGGREILERASKLADKNAKALDILGYIDKIYSDFESAGYGNNMMIDLGIVQGIDYYTGLVFKGYVPGIGEPVLSGGRYDSLLSRFGLSQKACGFAVNVSELAEHISLLDEKAALVQAPDFSSGAESIGLARDYMKKVLK